MGLAAGGGIGVASAGPLAPTTTVTTTETDATTSFVDGPTVTETVGATTVTNTVTATTTTTGVLPNGSSGGSSSGGSTTTDCNGADPCPPRGPSGKDGTYNCSGFDTQQRAQDYFDQVGNIDGLDANGDGIPCQSLP